MYHPSENEFIELSKRGNLIPVYREILGDLDTPVSAYLKVARGSEYSFLLESVEGEERIARFSFIAKNPELIFESKNGEVKITQLQSGKPSVTTKKIQDTPLSYLRGIMGKYHFVDVPGLPRFCGGMVGFLSYDMVRFFERLPQKTTDDLKMPDGCLILTKNLIIFDHRNHKMKIVSCAEIDPKAKLAQKKIAYQKALKIVDQLVAQLQKPLTAAKNNAGRKHDNYVESTPKSNVTQSQFEALVSEAKKQIRAGEIIQVVLSQRFETDLKTDPFNVYRRLRVINPSAYMYYLNFKDIQIVGSSPELLVRCENGLVETRPIAGTRPRGKDEAEDQRWTQELLNDPKEKAEHIMLVDLGRNDLGRVCKQGTVKVSEFMSVEKYSHVMHIVSNVQGQLAEGKDNCDVLQATFPAGTVSGAPKIRAMEIIEDLENLRRGPYAGCIGYFSFSGNLDTCITIRTIVIKNKKAYTQAGAGIVADSNPKNEFNETVNKARAQLLAIDLAHKRYENGILD